MLLGNLSAVLGWLAGLLLAGVSIDSRSVWVLENPVVFPGVS